ncbi:MAG: chromate efflux transporter [Oxalobacteraceae bacterium]|nr:chromate efflux transporter [Oxalobacteraceae bacterium]
MQNDSDGGASPPSVTLSEAFRYWLRLGFISFGGPSGQIALMHDDLVEKKRWISEQRFLHALNYCMLLPGPEAMQLATYIGWLMHRTAGGIIAGCLFVLPSLLILITLSWAYLAFGDVPVVAGILYGIKPAVVALVLAAAWRIGQRSLHNRWLLAVAVLACLLISAIQLPFPAVIGIAALIGAVGARYRPSYFSLPSHHTTSEPTTPTALIDDHTPPPFTKAALLSFGGAYAVLPYVYQGAVDHFGWLSAGQMIDGLALGETTPGPLIMIVAFVGFVGGWTQEVFGPFGLFWSGCAGALVATFFTFLPSFVFILAGAPLVEATRGNLRLSAVLSAISAAVVGVIVSLGALFAAHVFRLEQALSRWDWLAILITSVAAIALVRFKVSTVRLLLACAITGLVISYAPIRPVF